MVSKTFGGSSILSSPAEKQFGKPYRIRTPGCFSVAGKA
jgi:hypothetical protein